MIIADAAERKEHTVDVEEYHVDEICCHCAAVWLCGLFGFGLCQSLSLAPTTTFVLALKNLGTSVQNRECETKVTVVLRVYSNGCECRIGKLAMIGAADWGAHGVGS